MAMDNDHNKFKKRRLMPSKVIDPTKFYKSVIVALKFGQMKSTFIGVIYWRGKMFLSSLTNLDFILFMLLSEQGCYTVTVTLTFQLMTLKSIGFINLTWAIFLFHKPRLISSHVIDRARILHLVSPWAWTLWPHSKKSLFTGHRQCPY